MSVEEARKGILSYGFDYHGVADESEELAARIDRLILEVQAEMPCYEYETEWDDEAETYSLETCPSCTARAELARREVAV